MVLIGVNFIQINEFLSSNKHFLYFAIIDIKGLIDIEYPSFLSIEFSKR